MLMVPLDHGPPAAPDRTTGFALSALAPDPIAKSAHFSHSRVGGQLQEDGQRRTYLEAITVGNHCCTATVKQQSYALGKHHRDQQLDGRMLDCGWMMHGTSRPGRLGAGASLSYERGWPNGLNWVAHDRLDGSFSPTDECHTVAWVVPIAGTSTWSREGRPNASTSRGDDAGEGTAWMDASSGSSLS
ncbi:hypothetical protein VTK73DRAFT_7284 [Phialemonium thermophilum]|uniref:Uncharacterized protein n=1 Tax=Phialemonium thermophilum TaxID=223376 RepID=A0ABR3WFR8_9PEZI